MHNVGEKTSALLVTCKEVVLQVCTDTTECMFLSCDKNVGQDDNITTANNKSFKSVAEFSYWNDTNTAVFAFMKKLRTD